MAVGVKREELLSKGAVEKKHRCGRCSADVPMPMLGLFRRRWFAFWSRYELRSGGVSAFFFVSLDPCSFRHRVALLLLLLRLPPCVCGASFALCAAPWIHGNLATRQVGAQECVRDLTLVACLPAALARADGRYDVLLVTAFFPDAQSLRGLASAVRVALTTRPFLGKAPELFPTQGIFFFPGGVVKHLVGLEWKFSKETTWLRPWGVCFDAHDSILFVLQFLLVLALVRLCTLWACLLDCWFCFCCLMGVSYSSGRKTTALDSVRITFCRSAACLSLLRVAPLRPVGVTTGVLVGCRV